MPKDVLGKTCKTGLKKKKGTSSSNFTYSE